MKKNNEGKNLFDSMMDDIEKDEEITVDHRKTIFEVKENVKNMSKKFDISLTKNVDKMKKSDLLTAEKKLLIKKQEREAKGIIEEKEEQSDESILIVQALAQAVEQAELTEEEEQDIRIQAETMFSGIVGIAGTGETFFTSFRGLAYNMSCPENKLDYIRILILLAKKHKKSILLKIASDPLTQLFAKTLHHAYATRSKNMDNSIENIENPKKINISEAAKQNNNNDIIHSIENDDDIEEININDILSFNKK